MHNSRWLRASALRSAIALALVASISFASPSAYSGGLRHSRARHLPLIVGELGFREAQFVQRPDPLTVAA